MHFIALEHLAATAVDSIRTRFATVEPVVVDLPCSFHQRDFVAVVEAIRQPVIIDS